MLERLLRRLDKGQNKPAEPICPKGFERIGHFLDTDIFVAGYPKSGNTWLQLMLPSLIYGFDPYRIPDSIIQELSPDVHYKAFYKRFGDLTTFKTHNLPQPEYRRVIQIVRDGRDVTCSFYHYNKARGSSVSMDELIDQPSKMPFGSWHQHIEEWNRNPYHADILVVKYEDLKTNCVLQLQRIADFIGINVSESDLQRVSNGSSVEKMQLREKTTGWDNASWPKEKRFVRQGIANAFKKELTLDQIRRFNKTAAKALELHGYEV